MRHIDSWLLAPVIAALPLAGCVQTAADAVEESKPATVEALEGTGLSRVLLSARAAERLGIETGIVRDTLLTTPQLAGAEGGGAPRWVIPYGAVLYDPSGNTWTYTSPDPLVFVRHPISIEFIEGDAALLSEGPPQGTTVVSVGAALLYGTEFGVGH